MQHTPSAPSSVFDEPVFHEQEKKSSSLTLLIGGLVVVTAILAGGLGFYFGSMQNTALGGGTIQVPSGPEPDAVACTLDAKICPDGSAVGRIGPKCEFVECPMNENNGVIRLSIPSDIRTLAGESRFVDVPVQSRRVSQPASATINGVEYRVHNTVAGGGLCPWVDDVMNEEENYSCEKFSESFPNAEALFVWKDVDRGIFALNTVSLVVDQRSTDVLMVSKEDDSGFTESEFEMWKQILQTAEFVQQSATLPSENL